MYQLDQNGPIIANEMRSAVVLHKSVGAYNVVSRAYGGTYRVFPHKTLKAAFRRLASVVGGKLRRRDEHAAVIVLPDLQCMNYREAQKELK